MSPGGGAGRSFTSSIRSRSGSSTTGGSSKYTEPWAAALSDLKHRLESSMEKIFEIYIRTTPERLWEAITDPEIRSKYNFGAGV